MVCDIYLKSCYKVFVNAFGTDSNLKINQNNSNPYSQWNIICYFEWKIVSYWLLVIALVTSKTESIKIRRWFLKSCYFFVTFILNMSYFIRNNFFSYKNSTTFWLLLTKSFRFFLNRFWIYFLLGWFDSIFFKLNLKL